MIWAKEETLSRKEIETIQLERLQALVKRVYATVLPYRKKMDALHVKPEDIRSLDDLRRLPFTDKNDLRENYPFGMFAVSKNDLIRIHASSGTTGKPTVVGYTRKDLDTWSDLVARTAALGGATSNDIAQICFGYGMFTGALGLHYGMERIGATVCPTSSGNTKKQIMYMRDFETTLLVATPSYAWYIAEVAKGMGIDPAKDLHVHIGLFGGEGMTDAMRSEMKSLWGEKMLVTQNYGLSELNGPGLSGECELLNGMHIHEDHFIPEIIDPVTHEVLPPGERGELVVTCLTKEALPMIRYRTKDITSLMYDPCPCGRTTARMECIHGRSDDMLVIRGVNVFPTQIEEVLFTFPQLGPHYEIVVDTKKHMDTLQIKVELKSDLFTDSYGQIEQLQKQITIQLKSMLGLIANVILVAPRTLTRFEGKAKRVTDLRQR